MTDQPQPTPPHSNASSPTTTASRSRLNALKLTLQEQIDTLAASILPPPGEDAELAKLKQDRARFDASIQLLESHLLMERIRRNDLDLRIHQMEQGLKQRREQAHNQQQHVAAEIAKKERTLKQIDASLRALNNVSTKSTDSSPTSSHPKQTR
jgi:hypothetical protein